MTVKVCIGENCHLKGAEVVVKTFKELFVKEGIEGKVSLKGSFCMRQCQEPGITVQVDDKFYKTAYEDAEAFFYKVIAPRKGA
jgi:NADH:ubiquinone oxidoreductase subunit E